MKHNEFALKYPEVVDQVQNIVFPCSIDAIKIKNAKMLVEHIIEKGELPIINMLAINDAINLYNVDDTLFEDYKDIKEDINKVLITKNKLKLDKNRD